MHNWTDNTKLDKKVLLPAWDGSGSGKVRVKDLHAHEHTRDPNFYPRASIPAGKVSCPRPHPPGTRQVSGTCRAKINILS